MTRARDLGVPFDGKPGKWNAITDVAGVEVGHCTIIAGEGSQLPGQGAVRTGVTAVFPCGKKYDPVFAGWYSFNGCGELTGTAWVQESGFLESNVMITETASVGTVRDSTMKWAFEHLLQPGIRMRDVFYGLPVVGETYSGILSDMTGFHVHPEHVVEALENAKSGPVEEGSVGGGTAMICHDFKGGIGTSSRLVEIAGHEYTLGVLVQANHGGRNNLHIAGVPVGREIPDLMPEIFYEVRGSAGRPVSAGQGLPVDPAQPSMSSIIIVVATDAPLLPNQLARLARRTPLGIGVVGGVGSNGSGDIAIAFSTANHPEPGEDSINQAAFLSNAAMTPLMLATVQATEEAIVNSLVAAQTMTGLNGNTVHALPHDRLQDVLRKYNRLAEI